MIVARLRALAGWTLVGAFFLAAWMVWIDRWAWPMAWAALGCLFAGVVLVGGARPRERVTLRASTPHDPGRAVRDAARRQVEVDAYAHERAEHERVEAALEDLLKRKGVARRYMPPMGGHMDKRQGDYRLNEPLALTAAELARLTGPLTRLEARETVEGRAVLISLSARDRHGGGIEVEGPSPAAGQLEVHPERPVIAGDASSG